MNGFELRKLAVNEEIDYLFLKDALKGYAQPRAKIKYFLKNNVLVRIKKGLYIFGEKYAESPFVKETLANLIYGPSALSLQYALSYYGLIPERVETLTSITNKRNKVFITPVGCFTYKYLPQNLYFIGLTEVYLDKTHPVLIATPEKALADCLMFEKNLNLLTITELEQLLFDSFRLTKSTLRSLNANKLKMIAIAYNNLNVSLLAKYLFNYRGKK